MANTRDLSLHDASAEALPLPPMVCGEDAATYDQLAARIAAALAAEREAAPPSIEEGEFALVPDAAAEADARGGAA